MALVKCTECGHDISTDASVCPNCGKPRTVSSKNTGIGCTPIVAIFVFAIVVLAFFSATDAPAPKIATPVMFDQSPSNQAKRKTAIEKAQAAGFLGRVGIFSRGNPEMWVTPQFMSLSFEDKQAATAGVYGYYFDGSIPYRRIFLIDNQTGKEIGEFSVKRGLKLNSAPQQ